MKSSDQVTAQKRPVIESLDNRLLWIDVELQKWLVIDALMNVFDSSKQNVQFNGLIFVPQ